MGSFHSSKRTLEREGGKTGGGGRGSRRSGVVENGVVFIAAVTRMVIMLFLFLFLIIFKTYKDLCDQALALAPRDARLAAHAGSCCRTAAICSENVLLFLYKTAVSCASGREASSTRPRGPPARLWPCPPLALLALRLPVQPPGPSAHLLPGLSCQPLLP